MSFRLFMRASEGAASRKGVSRNFCSAGVPTGVACDTATPGCVRTGRSAGATFRGCGHPRYSSWHGRLGHHSARRGGQPWFRRKSAAGLWLCEALNQLVRARPTSAETPQEPDGPHGEAIHTSCEFHALIAACLTVRPHRTEDPTFTLEVTAAPVPESATL